MPELLKTLLSLSLSGTLLILLLLLLRPVYRNRLSKRWQYYIWLLVIARLLLPLTPETSLMGTLFRQVELQIERSAAGVSVSASIGTHDTGNTDSNTEPLVDEKDTAINDTGSLTSPTDTSEPGTTSPTVAEADTSGLGTNTADTKTATDNYPQPATGTMKNKLTFVISENTIRTICILWLVVALLLFVHKITVYQSFAKYVTAGSKPVDDIALLERFGQIIAKSHVNSTLDLCTNSLVSSPLLIGFLHPRIVLPTTDLSEDDFYYTILHELTHYKRRDIFYKWLVQLTICLHWFNPFVYLMEHEISRSCELSCDERVIMTLSDKSRKSYGDTLLNAIGTGGSYKDTLASVTLNESKELLKERLNAIMKYRKIPKSVQTAAIFFTGILIGGATVLGAYAAPTAKSSSDRLIITDDTMASDGKTTTGSTDLSDSEVSSATGNSMAQDSSATDQIPDYTIQYEDGTFYILTGDATEADKPSSVVTNGYSCLVLVRKDEYHSFGSWRDREMQNLVRHITSQCRTALENGRMTQEDMDIVITAATEIQEAYRSGADIQETYRSANDIQKFYLFGNNDSVSDDSGSGNSVTLYNYTQSARYQAPYIIEIGYNLTSEAQSKYSSTLITLSDQSTMPVFFSAKSEKYISDEAAMSAITALIERMTPNAAKSTRPLEVPFIVSMEYVGETNMDSLAKKYYDEEMLTYFGAIFLELDTETQQDYLDRMFEDGNISFFACCIGMFEYTDIQGTQRQKDVVDHYIIKAYEEDKVNFFAVLAGEFDEETRKSWLERCKNDGRTNYYYILFDEEADIFNDTGFMDDTDYFEEWDEPEDDTDVNSYFDHATPANVMDVTRTTKQDVSLALQGVLDSCDSGKWYVITENDCRYIYYAGLRHTYAYEPRIDGSEAGDQITVAITDIGVNSPLLDRMESLNNYVLLELPYAPGITDKEYKLALTYNKVPVSYDTISVASGTARSLHDLLN